MMIEIDDDCIDSVMQTAIVKDYVSLTKDLEHKENFHPDDVEAFEEVTKALKVLGNNKERKK